jgi:hypothetical protein
VVAWSGRRERASALKLLVVTELPPVTSAPLQVGLVSAGAGSMAAASSRAWRMLKASMIWEKPRNNAKNPTQNKIRQVRWARAYTRSDPDTQQLAVEYAYRQRPLSAAAAGRCNPSAVADGTRRVLLKATTSTSLLLILDAWRDQSRRPE